MKTTVNILRILTGLLFIFSGLIKANDPLGLAYKMDEYFTVWHWYWASPFSLYLSIGMNVLEIVAGVALLLGWAPKFITRLLLALMIFFTFLTGYAVLSGKIKTCGCFGDCLPLQAWQSFAKDVVLTAIILLLVWQHKFIQPLLPLRANLFALLFCTGLVFFGQLNVLKHLPYVDCLPYAPGKNLLQQMDPPAGAIPDSVAIFYTYRKAGKNLVFDAMHFPADFDESSYEYVSREEKVVRKGNAEPAIKDFALYSRSKTDTTRQILKATGKQLLFFAKDFNGYRPEWQELFVKLYTKAKEKSVAMYILSNQPENAEEWFNETNHFNVPVLTCDGTVMKTMLRSKVGVVALQGATIAAKWSEADMNNAIKWMNER